MTTPAAITPAAAERPASGRILGTAVHTLRALELFAQHPRGVTAKAIAHRLGVSLSSAYGLINSLRSEGFVEPSPAGSGLFTLSGKVVGLYQGFVEASAQPERLEPFLEELRDRTRARAYAALWKRGDLEVVQILGRRGTRDELLISSALYRLCVRFCGEAEGTRRRGTAIASDPPSLPVRKGVERGMCCHAPLRHRCDGAGRGKLPSRQLGAYLQARSLQGREVDMGPPAPPGRERGRGRGAGVPAGHGGSAGARAAAPAGRPGGPGRRREIPPVSRSPAIATPRA